MFCHANVCFGEVSVRIIHCTRPAPWSVVILGAGRVQLIIKMRFEPRTSGLVGQCANLYEILVSNKDFKLS